MATILQLVPSVGSTSATLDLNQVGFGLFQLMLSPEPAFPPPPLRRSTVGTLLTDGQTVPASAYDNRTIAFTLRLLAASAGQKATALTGLGRELNKQNGVLRLQWSDASVATWYRLLRSPSNPIRRLRPDGKALLVDVELVAEPFGLGAAVTVGPTTVNNDPAAGSNGCFIDVTGVTGDVDTKPKIKMSANSNNMAPILAVRRHGIVTDIAPLVQAEAATQGTDTTTGADALMSGGSRSRCSFATVATMATRLTVDLPYSGGLPRTAARGNYRLWVMIASSNNTSVYALRQRIVSGFGGSIPMLTGPTVTYTPTVANDRYLADLDLFGVPVGPDPLYDGYGGEANCGGVQVQIQVQRVSGAGSLDLDFVAAMPADEETCRMATTYLDIVLDGANNTIFTPGGFDEVTAASVPAIARDGGIPKLTPDQTNRIYILRPDGLGTGFVHGPDVKSRTASLTITWNPCYLTWAP